MWYALFVIKNPSIIIKDAKVALNRGRKARLRHRKKLDRDDERRRIVIEGALDSMSEAAKALGKYANELTYRNRKTPAEIIELSDELRRERKRLRKML